MTTYIIRRLILTIPLLFGISIISFMMVYLAPGDPGSMFVDPNISYEDKQKFLEHYGLNDPIHIQYLRWLGQILQGNFGYSLIQQGVPVSELIISRLPNTLLLLVTATIVAFLISIHLGVISAAKPYTKTDYTVTTLSFLGLATPNFWIGLVLIMVFSVHLGWLPAGGVATLNQPFSIIDRLLHLIMPTIVLATADMASLTRYARTSMMEVLGQDFIRTARAKGFKKWKVIYKHGLRNGLIPLVTIFGLMLPSLIGGGIITEKIFNWPGIGLLFLEATFQRDYPMIMAGIMISSTLVVIGTLISDILYAIIDQRIEY